VQLSRSRLSRRRGRSSLMAASERPYQSLSNNSCSTAMISDTRRSADAVGNNRYGAGVGTAITMGLLPETTRRIPSSRS
jgi:hypothetical protein